MELTNFITQKETELAEIVEQYEELNLQLANPCSHICFECMNKATGTQEKVTALSQRINDLSETIKQLKVIN